MDSNSAGETPTKTEPVETTQGAGAELKPIYAPSERSIFKSDLKPALNEQERKLYDADATSSPKEEVVEEIDEGEDAEEDEEEEEEETVVETYLTINLLHKEPAYAELCSFFNLYSSLLGLKPVNFDRLDKLFTTLHNGEADKELIELHITLMRKIYLKSARADKWDCVLLKFCSICPALEQELRQLQRYGYSALPMPTKLAILRALCESQFDCNIKFKENIFNSYNAREMRLAPIGVDEQGQSYFYQQDSELNLRVYSVEPDDLSGGTWQMRAKTQDELVELIAQLKSSYFPDSNGASKSAEGGEGEGMTEAEKEKFSMENDLSLGWDLYRDGSAMNKKKLEREKRRKEKEQALQASDKVEEGGEEEAHDGKPDADVANADEDDFDPTPFLDDGRRVLPRRNARENAITNLKSITASPTKRNVSKKGTDLVGARDEAKPLQPQSRKGKVKSPSPPATSSESASEDEEDEEESSSSDEDASDGNSDEDFDPDSQARSTVVVKGYGGVREKRREKKAKQKRKPTAKRRRPKKAKSHSARAAMRFDIGRLKKQQKMAEVSTVELSSEEEDNKAVQEEQIKERKKATEKSLCMKCNGSKRPDLLLLCDRCDDPWHTFCLNPKLWFVPAGDWFCPRCEHLRLIQRLTFALNKLREDMQAKEAEAKRKQEVADRLKKEMDFIGIQLNNIIPAPRVQKSAAGHNAQGSASSEEEEDDLDDGQRKSKKRAMKKVMAKGTRKRLAYEQFERLYGPIVTVAEGRSRRSVKQVDYNFQAYESQLKEAMADDGSAVSAKNSPGPSGLGKGKDMANIINADLKRQESMENMAGERDEMLPARPPSSTKRAVPPVNKKRGKQKRKKKLTDLDLDNATESSEDSDAEYKITSDEYQEEEPEPSEDEYLPREFQRRSTRFGARGPTRSDEEFIDDRSLSDDSGGPAKRRGKKKRKRGRLSSDSEASEEYQSGSDESYKVAPKKRGGRAAIPPSKRPKKWPAKAPSTDSEGEEDEEELEMPSDGSSEEGEKTEAGRPLRKAAANMKKKMKEINKMEHELDEELNGEGSDGDNHAEATSQGETATGSARPVGALTRSTGPTSSLHKRKILSDDEGDAAEEFKPSSEDEDEESASEVGSSKGGDGEEEKEAKEVGLPEDCGKESGKQCAKKSDKAACPPDANESIPLLVQRDFGGRAPMDCEAAKRTKGQLDFNASADSRSLPEATNNISLVSVHSSVGSSVILGKKVGASAEKASESNGQQHNTGFAKGSRLPHKAASADSSSGGKTTLAAAAEVEKRTLSDNGAKREQPLALYGSSIPPSPSYMIPAATSSAAHKHNPTLAASIVPMHQTAPHAPLYTPQPYHPQQLVKTSFGNPALIPQFAPTSIAQYGGMVRQQTPLMVHSFPVPSHQAAPQSFYHELGSQPVYEGQQQPIGGPQFVVDPRTGQLIDASSLGHVLAGAMNPEDL